MFWFVYPRTTNSLMDLRPRMTGAMDRSTELFLWPPDPIGSSVVSSAPSPASRLLVVGELSRSSGDECRVTLTLLAATPSLLLLGVTTGVSVGVGVDLGVLGPGFDSLASCSFSPSTSDAAGGSSGASTGGVGVLALLMMASSSPTPADGSSLLAGISTLALALSSRGAAAVVVVVAVVVTSSAPPEPPGSFRLDILEGPWAAAADVAAPMLAAPPSPSGAAAPPPPPPVAPCDPMLIVSSSSRSDLVPLVDCDVKDYLKVERRRGRG